jgi:hypothetical protein
VPVPLGLDVELSEGVLGAGVLGAGVLLLGGGVIVAGGGAGEVEVGGDADGMRSPGRSPTRSVRDSLQAASKPRPSASAQSPVAILFMCGASSCGVRDPFRRLQRGCRHRLFDRARCTYYQWNDSRRGDTR